MESYAIPDSKITASSRLDVKHEAARSRLNTVKQESWSGAWVAKFNDVFQWLEVEFPKVVKVTAVATQGRQDRSQWVKSYSIDYSVDGSHFKKYRGGKFFKGNNDRNTIVHHILEPAIYAKAIRILPATYYGHISMRMELYGCMNCKFIMMNYAVRIEI